MAPEFIRAGLQFTETLSSDPNGGGVRIGLAQSRKVSPSRGCLHSPSSISALAHEIRNAGDQPVVTAWSHDGSRPLGNGSSSSAVNKLPGLSASPAQIEDASGAEVLRHQFGRVEGANPASSRR
ncbi:hypothetical protein, partial [Mesorhizobium sp.]|uniref:hypothetical protein n=1 Tax=Mesorhizobium sp. TaxID=1871066 RepID=UPI0025B86AE4